MLRVLLVEDENIIRRGLHYQVDWTEANCVVIGEAATGKEGLEKIAALKPDIVITDIRMPDMDGLEMLRQGQAMGDFSSIIISGYSEFDYAKQAIRLGVTEYLLKPVDIDELKNCLHVICDRQLPARRQDSSAGRQEPLLLPELMQDTAVLKNKYANTMLAYIRKNYGRQISLTDLSLELNISCTHLNTKFKAETGYTFHGFLNYYRICKAVELQKTGLYRLYEIAEMVGFSDYKYFNKVFKKYTGYSPRVIFPPDDEH